MKATTLKALNKEFAGHMQWQIEEGHFQRVSNTAEGDILSPESCAEFPGNAEAAEAYGVDPEDVETLFGWFCRLSAPGYMDCTDWSGPYESEEEAAQELLSMFAD